MRVCIVGKQGVGKTRFYCALLNEKYVNKPTVDFHEKQLEQTCILIDTPAYNLLQFKNITQYAVDLILIFIDGSRPLSSLDLECIDLVRKLNIDFEIVIGLGTQYEDELLYQLPKGIEIHYAVNTKQIKKFRQLLISKQMNISYENQSQAQQSVVSENAFLEDTHTEDAKAENNTLKWIIVGKENAGKSTLLNVLAGQERVKVSATAGTTKASVDCQVSFNGNDLSLKDTAGVKRSNLQYVKYLLEKKSLVLFMIDSTLPLSHSDKRLLNQIMIAGLACVVVLNKIDSSLKKAHESNNSEDNKSKQVYSFEEQIRFEISKLFKFLPIMSISALKGWGINELIAKAKEVEAKAVFRISTSKLNKWIELEKHRFHGTKIKYACHVSTSPYEVTFFVSPMNTSKQVISHLRNLFQEYFQLYGVCVKILMRSARSANRASNIPVEVKRKRLLKRQ